MITQHVPRKRSPLSRVFFYRLDGAYSRAGEDDTAFSGRRAPCYGVFIIAQCPAPELLVEDRRWVRSFWQALLPHTPGVGSYINAMTEVEEDRLRAAYGSKYDRLAAIKATYDPENVFHRNANIRPRV